MSIRTEIDRIRQSKTNIISSIEAKGVSVPADASIDDLSALVQAIEIGTKPTGNINITNMNTVDVTNYATAKVVDSDLIASNIKSGVNILGVTGTLESVILPSSEEVAY